MSDKEKIRDDVIKLLHEAFPKGKFPSHTPYKFALFLSLITILIMLLFSYRVPQQTVYISEPQVNSEITPATYPQKMDTGHRFGIPGCSFQKIRTVSPVQDNSQVNEI